MEEHYASDVTSRWRAVFEFPAETREEALELVGWGVRSDEVNMEMVDETLEQVPEQSMEEPSGTVCEECAAVVADELRHANWHDRLNGRTSDDD